MSPKRNKGRGPKKRAATPARPVDVAMRADRAAKSIVRQKWLEILKEVGTPQGPHPVYLTLPGAEGKDVQILIDEELISVNETGAIASESANYCVAIENSLNAVLELQRKFPGLRIIHQNIKGVLRGESLLSFPAKDDRTSCQAHVVNLDLQATLEGQLIEDEASFPVLKWIEKFGTLHLECAHKKWYLLLTLNATIQWSEEMCKWVTEFLRTNFADVAEFRSHAARILDQNVLQAIEKGSTVAYGTLRLDVRQKVLLVLVPKAIGFRLCRQGWSLTTRFNAEYSGANGAPMVTYIFALSKVASQPRLDKLYVEALTQCLTKIQRVTEKGDVQDF